MPRTRRSLNDFLAEGGDSMESRAYRIDDFAFFAFKVEAVKEGFGGNIGAYMSQLARRIAKEAFSEHELEEVRRLAEEETQKRRESRIKKANLTQKNGEGLPQ